MKKRKVKPGGAPAPPDSSEFSLIANEKLLALYSALLKCRTIARQFPGKGKRSQLISEAVTVGATIDLLASDAVSPAPSDLTPCLLKGVALKTLSRLWRNPSARIPAAFSRANVIPPSASCFARLEATTRLAAHFKSAAGESVLVFFADPAPVQSNPAAFSPDQLASSLRKAATQRLPILFIQRSDGKKEDWIPLAEQCGIPAIVVDRDDVVAVYRVTSEALSHARRGNGPTLIACQPWRVTGRGRKMREVRDCIRKMELYLTGKGLAFRRVKAKITENFVVELDRTTLA